MANTLMILQALVSVLLIIVVLLQFGKGAEAGLMSGGGASDSVFTGAQQGNILSKITIVLSILFLGNSILLSKIQSSKTSKSILDGEAPVARPLNSDAEKVAPVAAPATKEEATKAAPANKEEAPSTAAPETK